MFASFCIQSEILISFHRSCRVDEIHRDEGVSLDTLFHVRQKLNENLKMSKCEFQRQKNCYITFLFFRLSDVRFKLVVRIFCA